jgi:hypothetical protein
VEGGGGGAGEARRGRGRGGVLGRSAGRGIRGDAAVHGETCGEEEEEEEGGWDAEAGTQFTCFTSTKVQMLICLEDTERDAGDVHLLVLRPMAAQTKGQESERGEAGGRGDSSVLRAEDNLSNVGARGNGESTNVEFEEARTRRAVVRGEGSIGRESEDDADQLAIHDPRVV